MEQRDIDWDALAQGDRVLDGLFGLDR